MHISTTTRLAAAIALTVVGIGHAMATPLYSVNSEAYIRAEATSFHGSGFISFGTQRFDPLQRVYGEQASYRTAADGRGLRFVQFNDAIEGDWLENLKDAGLRPLQYYPDNTYLVWSDGSAAERAASWPQVRWQGDYLPDWKFSPDLGEREGLIKNVGVFFYNDGDIEATLEAMRLTGAKVLNHGPAQPDKAFFDAWIEADASTLTELSQLPQVVWLEYADPNPRLDDEISSQILARNYSAANVPALGYLPWLASIGYNGNGVTWAVIDSGVDLTHPDLASRIVGGVTYPGCPAGNGPGDDNVQGGHGTHVAGIIAGTGATGNVDAAGFLYGLGVAPGTRIFAQNPLCLSSAPWPPAGGWQVLSQHALVGGATGGNGSWSTAESGSGTIYSAATRVWDQIARDGNFETTAAEPFVMTFAAGNSGPDPGTLATGKAAKNSIITGSSRNYRAAASATTIDTLDISSSRGPTNDGRFGPTIVAPGQDIASTKRVAGASECATSIPGTNNRHSFCSGTSMASPHAAGIAALLTQWWRDQNAGATPSPAMIKALLINGAKPMGAATIPNTNVGWGRVDLPGSLGHDYLYSVTVDQSALLTTVGQVWEATYGVPETDKPLKISLAWTDAAAATGANPALVNNLDLEVITDGQTYLGNVFAANVSTTGGTADSRNNTEGVIIANPGATVTVRVRATNLPGDAVPDNATLTDQDFALVCRNCASEPGFRLVATPTAPQSVCVPSSTPYTVQVGSILGYTTPVSLAVSGQPAGTSAGFSINPVSPGGSSVLTVNTTGTTSPGEATLTITGSNADRTSSLSRQLLIATATPTATTPTAPGNATGGQPLLPTLTWTASAQAVDYRVQVATDVGFSAIVVDATVTDTSYTLRTPLLNRTTYYWRVIGNNGCGVGTPSTVFQFRTVIGPGGCEFGQTQINVFTEDFSTGANGFTTGGTGPSWALSTARPSPASGGNAMKSAANTFSSNQLLTSPAISLPTGQLPLTLNFLNWRFLEHVSSLECWDGGFLEIAVNGGAFAPIPPNRLLNDPYNGTLDNGGAAAWCGEAPVDYRMPGTLVDLSQWAGSSVRLRWRVITENVQAREGWYVDDIKVTSCSGDVIFRNGFDSN